MKEMYVISYIAKEVIPVKYTNDSPLDFFGFGYLKPKLSSKKMKKIFIEFGKFFRRCGLDRSRSYPKDIC